MSDRKWPKARIRTRGMLWWKEGWYSICSAHYHHDPQCNLCTKGVWLNSWQLKYNQILFKIDKGLWEKHRFVLADEQIEKLDFNYFSEK